MRACFGSAHEVSIVMMVALATSGCITDVAAQRMPGKELDRSSAFYVVRDEEDERGRPVEDLIVESLARRGMDASSGPLAGRPSSAGVLVKFDCQWQWDITWYLLELYVGFYELPSERLVVSGHSKRTSLARASPESMVEEVLAAILDEQE